MKIAIAQYTPELGKLERNISNLNSLLERTDLNGVEWLLLPELSLTGYNFETLDKITPFLEPTAAGPSTIWAKETARKYNCKVTVGYPELATENETLGSEELSVNTIVTSSKTTELEPQSVKRYNSTVTVDQTGRIITHYRKRYLYTTDESWASSGPEHFFVGYVDGVGKVCMGICMDLNSDPTIPVPEKYRVKRSTPKNAEGEKDGEHEQSDGGIEQEDRSSVLSAGTSDWLEAFLRCDFARFVQQKNPDLVVVNMAWLTNMTDHEFDSSPDKIETTTFQYWMERFRPLYSSHQLEPVWTEGKKIEENGGEETKNQSPTYRIVLANRTGQEGASRYAGSSCALRLRPNSLELYDYCDRSETACMVIDLDSEPNYKWVVSTSVE